MLNHYTRTQQLKSLKSLQGFPTCSFKRAVFHGRLCNVCFYGSKGSNLFGSDARSSMNVSRPDAALFACSYFAVVVYKVLVLLVEELGGSNTFLTRFSGKPFRINTGPCCCCCMCLPRVPMSRYLRHYVPQTVFTLLTVLLLRLFSCVPAYRRLLFWLKIGALQYAILKTVLSIFSIVLWTNGNFDLSDVSKVFISKKCTRTTWSQKHVVASL